MKAFVLMLALFSLVAAGVCQATAPPKEEFDSVDSIVKALYGVISGPAGQKRDWDRMRSLFQPEARMIAVGKNREGVVRKQVLTVEDYIKGSGPFLEERGFFEKEVARRVEQYGNIAHVFSTYESRMKAEDPKPFMRGINSFQLWNDGKRWWVVTVFWQQEDPTTPLPDKYLKDQ
ncbi:MAG: hypothetical protein ACAH95_12950 [Fimbriimonas sp.]